MRQRRRVALPLVLLWLAVAVPATVLVFAHSSTTTVIASHDAVVRPTFDGYATLGLGPYLPNLRYPTGSVLGADIALGKTNLTSYDALIRRYAVIGSQPEGEVGKLRGALARMALDGALTGSALGLAGPGLWLALGARRRAELLGGATVARSAYVALAGVVTVAVVTQPWQGIDPGPEDSTWSPVREELPDIPIPARLRPLQVETGLMTSGTRRLAESAIDTYTRSVAFYRDVVAAVPSIRARLRRPGEGETVALLVSDRHDNVGMDKVARAVADAGGATVLLDAGDDTSTGGSWEAFSLDSFYAAFGDLDHRYAVAGNHDHGGFVTTYLDRLGFTTFEGDVVDGPADIRLLGANDPRSSGLGTWRDETGLSFAAHAEAVADRACAYDADGERVSTLLVHDANTGRPALERGCVDLVLSGHLHAQLGPSRVEGRNGRVGYTYTNGTTGGAAYTLAIGSKLRRDAQVTLVTYRHGRPVGLQPVTVRTLGDFEVSPYLELDLGG